MLPENKNILKTKIGFFGRETMLHWACAGGNPEIIKQVAQATGKSITGKRWFSDIPVQYLPAGNFDVVLAGKDEAEQIEILQAQVNRSGGLNALRKYLESESENLFEVESTAIKAGYEEEIRQWKLEKLEKQNSIPSISVQSKEVAADDLPIQKKKLAEKKGKVWNSKKIKIKKTLPKPTVAAFAKPERTTLVQAKEVATDEAELELNRLFNDLRIEPEQTEDLPIQTPAKQTNQDKKLAEKKKEARRSPNPAIKKTLPPSLRGAVGDVAIQKASNGDGLLHSARNDAESEVAEIKRLEVAYGLVKEAQVNNAEITQEQDRTLIKKLQEHSVEISQDELKFLREANLRSDTFEKSNKALAQASQTAQTELSFLNKFLKEPPRKYPDKTAEEVVEELRTLGLTVPKLEEIVGNWKFFNDAREQNLNIHPDDIETDQNTTRLSQQILAEVNSKRKAPLKEFSELFKHQVDANDELKRKTQIAERSLAAIKESRKKLEETLYSRINPQTDQNGMRLLSNQESLALFEKFKKAA